MDAPDTARVKFNWPALLIIVGAGLLGVIALIKQAGPVFPAKIEYETRSDFSHIRVRRAGDVRSLMFVRDDGKEVTESRVNLAHPERLELAYSRSMFANYLFQSQPKRVLIVGLGGGAMVKFLEHHDPDVVIDVVEIDPEVVEIAAKYFAVQTNDQTTIHTADGFAYLRETLERYDVIYMDAFLKPAEDTDATGVPIRFKTVEFFREIQEKLNPDGMVVFNLNSHQDRKGDIASIAEAFDEVAVFDCQGSRNMVVVGLTMESGLDVAELDEAAVGLDERFSANFSFKSLIEEMRPTASKEEVIVSE